MQFIKAFGEVLGGTFTDQWKIFYALKTGVSGTAGLFPFRHKYETETKTNMITLKINRTNNTSVSGQILCNQLLNLFVNQKLAVSLIRNAINPKEENNELLKLWYI